MIRKTTVMSDNELERWEMARRKPKQNKADQKRVRSENSSSGSKSVVVKSYLMALLYEYRFELSNGGYSLPTILFVVSVLIRFRFFLKILCLGKLD